MTATRAALLELATRCEQASGPDASIDEAIMTALFLREERFIGTEEEQEDGTWAPVADAVWVDPSTGKWVRTHAREFTASLDAALTLYDEVPTLIHSNPRWVARDALIQRADRLAAEAPQ